VILKQEKEDLEKEIREEKQNLYEAFRTKRNIAIIIKTQEQTLELLKKFSEEFLAKPAKHPNSNKRKAQVLENTEFSDNAPEHVFRSSCSEFIKYYSENKSSFKECDIFDPIENVDLL